MRRRPPDWRARTFPPARILANRLSLPEARPHAELFAARDAVGGTKHFTRICQREWYSLEEASAVAENLIPQSEIVGARKRRAH
jgi:hypothetical protein